MTAENKPTWDEVCKAFADFYVSRLTQDEMREISFAFDNHIQNRLFVEGAEVK